MQRVCPLCNGLIILNDTCACCGHKLEDQGLLQDFRGPYSPYMDQGVFTEDNLNASSSAGICYHMLTCPQCEAAFVKGFQRILF